MSIVVCIDRYGNQVIDGVLILHIEFLENQLNRIEQTYQPKRLCKCLAVLLSSSIAIPQSQFPTQSFVADVLCYWMTGEILGYVKEVIK